mgnify:CR=1 FL=1
MSRRPIFAANWKMNKGIKDAEALAEGVKRELGDCRDVDVVLLEARHLVAEPHRRRGQPAQDRAVARIADGADAARAAAARIAGSQVCYRQFPLDS